ncbi:MAG TPA: DUF2071 domain-containing protein [Chthoniobacteraceae bacterium]|jgi:uncharacterized protein YqjF (DUF2071 family)|nr:DUF2071 domain-containing protein [Chthoniobacteraceae bacterium]
MILVRLPVMTGLIRRRLLINFRVDPEVIQRLLPAGMSPKLHGGHAIAGICLIRLEQIRPKGMPAFVGAASENAAHRIAVEWAENGGERREGVFIPRRDTNSALAVLAGGRIFPGVHHYARFTVKDDGTNIEFEMASREASAQIRVRAREAALFPGGSCFASLADASAFFERGCVGFSVTPDADRLDGLQLCTVDWQVRPLDVLEFHSGFFADETKFPKGSVEFDHGLIMRDISHEWISQPDYRIPGRQPQDHPAASGSGSGVPAGLRETRATR